MSQIIYYSASGLASFHRVCNRGSLGWRCLFRYTNLVKAVLHGHCTVSFCIVGWWSCHVQSSMGIKKADEHDTVPVYRLTLCSLFSHGIYTFSTVPVLLKTVQNLYILPFPALMFPCNFLC